MPVIIRPYSERNRVEASMSSNSRNVPVQLIRKTSLEDFNDQMIGMLDEVEKRVEQFRLFIHSSLVFQALSVYLFNIFLV